MNFPYSSLYDLSDDIIRDYRRNKLTINLLKIDHMLEIREIVRH